MERPVVFIVEDDQVVRDSITELLELRGFEANQYPTAESFLACRPTGGVLIVDIRLPGITGLELLEQLQIEGHRYRSIVVTGHGEGGLTEELSQRGVVGVLEKPYDPRHLLDLLGQLV